MSDLINGSSNTTPEEYSQTVEYFEQWLRFLKQSFEVISFRSPDTLSPCLINYSFSLFNEIQPIPLRAMVRC
jgi:hypothetical protein